MQIVDGRARIVRGAWLGILPLVLALLVACGSPGPQGAKPAGSKGAAGQESAGGAFSASNGQQLFTSRTCGACHAIQGIPGAGGTIGPNLSAIAAVADRRKPGTSAEDYLRESIVDPDAHVVLGYQPGSMPRVPLSDQQVGDLVAFLLTRK